MKKLLALLLALMLCATAAFAEEGVFDYTVFEENEDIDLEIDRFDDEWSVTVVAMSTVADMPAGLVVHGKLDGEIDNIYLGFAGDHCDEVRILLDDTMYTFDTRMQEEVLGSDACAIILTPETEPFFQALATAESVDIRLTTASGEDIDTSITGSDLEETQFVLTKLFEQDVLDCHTDEMQENWELLELLQFMTVD